METHGVQQPADGIHLPFCAVYANAAARNAATTLPSPSGAVVFGTLDLYKLALTLDTKQIHMLVDIGPTWLLVGALPDGLTLDANGSGGKLQVIDGSITNVKVSNAAAIAGSKINPDFGAQNVSFIGDLSVTGNASINGDVGISANASIVGNLDVGSISGDGSGLANLPSSSLSGDLPGLNGSALTDLNASALTTGTLTGGIFPATLPAADGSALTNLNGGAIAATSIPIASLQTSGTLPALDGSALVNLPAPAGMQKAYDQALDGSGQLAVTPSGPTSSALVACWGTSPGNGRLAVVNTGAGAWSVQSSLGAADAGFQVNWISVA